MYPRTKQLAAVASEDVRSLIRVLYCVSVYAESGAVIKNTLKEDGNKTLSFAKFIGMKNSLSLVAKSIKSRTDINEQDLVDLGVSIGQSVRSVLQSEVGTVSFDDMKMLRAFAAVFKKGNENALRWLEKNASVYGNAEIVSAFVKEKSDLPSQQDLRKRLITIVKQLVGKNEPVIQPENIQKIRDENPELYKEYVRLRKEFNAAWKAFVSNMVRSSGKKYLPYDEVVNVLNKEGITHRLPKGFVGNIDDNNALYTEAGKKLNGFPGSDVEMNEDYDPKKDDTFVFRVIKPTSRSGLGAYGYTKEFLRSQNVQKHENVRKSLGKIDLVRKKWTTSVKGQPDTKIGVVATVLELLYKFSARIGSVGNQTEGKSTFGISTLLVKHIVVDANGIIIRYPGKAAGKGGAKVMLTVHKLKPITPVDKLLIRNIKDYIAGKEKDERVFTYETNTGKKKPVTGNDVNLWFKSAMGSRDAHVHMLRHSIANKMFEQLLSETKFKANLSQSELESQFKRMVMKIGAALGHRTGTKVTAGTVLAAYLDPVLSVGFFQDKGYRVPKFLERFTVSVASTNFDYDPLEGDDSVEISLTPNLRSKVHDEYMLSPHIVVRHDETPGDNTSIINTYTVSGDLVGGESLGKRLAELNIKPEKIESSDSICAIGNDRNGKWYGWVDGHAIKGFPEKDEAIDYVRSILNPKELIVE